MTDQSAFPAPALGQLADAIADRSLPEESRRAAFAAVWDAVALQARSLDAESLAIALRRCVMAGDHPLNCVTEAVEAYSRLRTLSEEREPFACYRHGLLLWKGSAPCVTEDLQKAAELIEFAAEKGVPHAFFSLGQLFSQKRKSLDPTGEKGLTAWRQGHWQGDGEASYSLYRRLRDTDRHAAFAILEEQADFTVPSIPGLVALSADATGRGDDARATQLLERAIEVAVLAQAPERAAAAHVALARLQIRQACAKDGEACDVLINSAHCHLESVPESRYEFNEASFWLAHIAHRRGDIRAAINHYGQSAARGNVPAMRSLAEIYKTPEFKDDSAAQHWEGEWRRLDNWPHHVLRGTGPWLRRLQSHCGDKLDEGDPQGVLDELDEVFAVAKQSRWGENHRVLKDAPLLELSARAHATLHHWEEAESRFRLALAAKDEPKNRGICTLGLAACLREQGKLDEARIILTDELEKNPHAALVCELADILELAGRQEDALIALERAVDARRPIHDSSPEKTADRYAHLVWRWARTREMGPEVTRRLSLATTLLLSPLRTEHERAPSLDSTSLRTLGAGARYAIPRREVIRLMSIVPRRAMDNLLEGMLREGSYHPDLLGAALDRIAKAPHMLQQHGEPALGQALAKVIWRTLAHAYYSDKHAFELSSRRVFEFLKDDISNPKERDDWLHELFVADRHAVEYMLVHRYCDSVERAIGQDLSSAAGRLAALIAVTPATVAAPAAYLFSDVDAPEFSVKRLLAMLNTRVYALAQAYGKTASAELARISVFPDGGLTSIDRVRITDQIIERMLHPTNGTLRAVTSAAMSWRIAIADAQENDLAIEIDFRGIKLSDETYKAARRQLQKRLDHGIVREAKLDWDYRASLARATLFCPLRRELPSLPGPWLVYLRGLESEMSRLHNSQTPDPGFFAASRQEFPGWNAFDQNGDPIRACQLALRTALDMLHGFFLERLTAGSDEGHSPVGLVHALKTALKLLAENPSAERMARLRRAVRSLRWDATRVLGRPRQMRQQTDVGALVCEVGRDLDVGRRISLEGSASCILSTDVRQLHRALIEHIGNAVREAPIDDVVTVRLETTLREIVIEIVNVARLRGNGNAAPDTLRTGYGARTEGRTIRQLGGRVESITLEGRRHTKIFLPRV